MTNKPCRCGGLLTLSRERGPTSRCAWALATGSPSPPNRGAGGAGGGALSRYRSLALDRRRRGPSGCADRRPYASCGADCRLVVGVAIVCLAVQGPRPRTAARFGAPAVPRACARPRAPGSRSRPVVGGSLGASRSSSVRHSNDVGAVPTEARRRRTNTRACSHHVARPRTRRRRWRANHLRDLGSGETTRRI
jgi:hypothetical protein